MAYKGFSPKALFQALDIKFVQEFFERFLPNQARTIDWNRDLFTTSDVIDCYNALSNDDVEKQQVGGDLEEIFAVCQAPAIYSDVVQQVSSVLHTEVPEEVRGLTVENLVMWVYLNHPEAWRRLVHVARATALPTNQWYAYRLSTASGKEMMQGIKQEALPAFKRDLTTILKARREGVAESVDVEITEVDGCEQVICYISNNLRSQTQMEQGKKVVKAVDLPREAYFRCSPQQRTLAIYYRGLQRKDRERLCEIFARRLKDAQCGVEITDCPQYRLSQLAGEKRLPIPSFSDVLDARVTEVSYCLPNKNTLVFGTPETPTDAREAVAEIIHPGNCNLAAAEIFQVKIRVHLSDRYGKRSQQTLTITKTGCDLKAKDVSVRKPLLRCLEVWGIVAC